jgi:hypothetical protein
MCAKPEAPAFASFNRVDEFPHSMSSINPLKRPVMHRLESEFEPKVSVTRDVADEIENLVRDTIRPRGNGKADNARKV